LEKSCGINVIVSGGAGFSPYSQSHDQLKLKRFLQPGSGSDACAATLFGRTVEFKFKPFPTRF
jgi:hypothetical protein